ncbi:hypothetical protein BC943DRAFT_274597 [Umbelopsis sp. AD052]|nr:hypothetical protein BC943DRAFT_274597 [Umbelopsis sp. AD052]
MEDSYTQDLDFASDHEDFSLPRNVQPTGYVDTDKLDQASMDSHLPETNIGYKLLLKMGWTAGEGLGSDRQGRVDPIRIDLKMDALGVGKAEELMEHHVSSTAQRRALDSEKQLEETEEEKLKRQMDTLKKEEVKNDIKEILRAFYCELCDKQYSKISEYEQHLQSYDHHHKKRFKDMRDASKKSEGAIAERESRRERERKREERENRRIHEAMLKKSGVNPDQIPSKGNSSKSGQSDLANGGSVAKTGSGSTNGEWIASGNDNKSRSGGWQTAPMESTNLYSGGKSAMSGWSTVTASPVGKSDGQLPQGSNVSSEPTVATTTKTVEVEKPQLFIGKKQPQKMSFGINKKPTVKFGFKKE